MKEFNFKFTLITINAKIDETNTLTIKQGIRTWKTEISRLTHLYVTTLPETGYELMLSYEDDSGKRKKIRCNSNFGQPDFEGLVNELVKLRPDIDIRTKGVNEAHKLMGAFNMVRIAPVIVFFLVMAVMTAIFLPGIIHGLDSGSQSVSLSDIQKPGILKTSNLTVTDSYLYIDNYLQVKTTGDSTTTVKDYIALVPESFAETDPITLVMETDDLTDEELRNMTADTSFKGLLRNVLWEGPPGDLKNDFKNELNLTLADNVMLLQYNTDHQADLLMSLIVLGASAVIMLIVCIIVALRTPK